MKEGSRIRLKSKMKNPDSQKMPEEDIPVNTEGTVVWVNCEGPVEYHQVRVNWDNGRTLSILPHIDKYELI